MLLLAQSLCEILCRFVYPILNRPCLGEKCLFVVQTLIKIRISKFCFCKHALCAFFVFFLSFFYDSLFISLCHFDDCVYVYRKQPWSCEAEEEEGRAFSRRCCFCFAGTSCCCCCCFRWSHHSPKPSSFPPPFSFRLLVFCLSASLFSCP